MQFGKKTRNLAAASRRFFGERPNQGSPEADRAVGTLEHSEEEENAMTPPPQEESMVAGDPTQRLLTALGRFQRQVSRAEEGAPQEAWCDECMNQLITGIEIALNEDWADVKEALTDVARILQTYEDVDRADQSVNFLKDSYEILCLMVGDLIVGNVRSGVMRKWQDRYERALDELADAGLTLVDDDSTGERESHGDRHAHDPSTAETLEAASDHDFDNMLDQGFGADIPDSVFDASNRHGSAFATAPEDPFAPLEQEDASPFGELGIPATPAEPASLPSLDELLGRPVAESDDLEEEENGEAKAMELSDDFTADNDESTEETLDLSPAPASAPEEEAVPDSLFAETSGDLIELDFGGDSDAEQESEPEAAPEPAPQAAPAPVRPAPVVAAAPAPPAEPEPGTPEAWFFTAQRAMAQGNLGDAKVFALQLAANMAKMEADQVAGRIAIIEADIAQNSQAIATGESAVGEAEHRVQQLEEQVALCQREFEAKREQISQLRDEAVGVETSIEDLNRQIAELEARRDAEVERLSNYQRSLDDNLSEESRMQSELEALSEEESGSRENLDGARDHVLILQQTGAAHAASLQAAQAELELRRASVVDIEHTIQQVGGGAPAVAAEPAADSSVDASGDEGGTHSE